MRETTQQLDTTAQRPYSAREYAGYALWCVVHALLWAWTPSPLNGWRCWLLRVFGADVRGATVRRTVRVRYPWLLKMGRHCALGDRVNLYNLGQVTLGDHTVVSQDVTLCAGTHDDRRPDLPLLKPPITIGSGVWVCAEAFIGPGVTIGDCSVVGARAVVMKDVPPGVVVAGNPARVVRQREMTEADGSPPAA